GRPQARPRGNRPRAEDRSGLRGRSGGLAAALLLAWQPPSFAKGEGMENEFPTYKAFWPHYVSEHQSKLNRNLHFLGTGLAVLSLVLAFVTGSAWLLPLAPLFGYAFAWAGHFYGEKNRPATFQYPLWSLMADFHMFALMCLGRMD